VTPDSWQRSSASANARSSYQAAAYVTGTLQRELSQGRNVWSTGTVNVDIFFGEGRIATNRRDGQELSVLCHRILQAALV